MLLIYIYFQLSGMKYTRQPALLCRKHCYVNNTKTNITIILTTTNAHILITNWKRIYVPGVLARARIYNKFER